MAVWSSGPAAGAPFPTPSAHSCAKMNVGLGRSTTPFRTVASKLIRASARKNEISGTANGPKDRGRSVMPGGGIRRRPGSIDGSARQAGAARQPAKRYHTMLWTVRIGMVPGAAIRIKRGIAGVERNGPALNWTAVFDSSRRVKDPSAA